MNFFRNISDIRFSRDKSGENHIISKLPGLRELNQNKELKDYFNLSIAADSLKVTSDLFPRESKVFKEVLSILNLSSNNHDFYISGENQRNAYILSVGNSSQIVMSSELISILDDDELKFVIGHELGHYLCKHSDIPTQLITQHEDIDVDFKLDVLKWSRCAEISADRYGVLCSGKLESSLSALYKVAFGITPPNLKLLRSTMRKQYQELCELAKKTNKSNQILSSRSHPIIPIRCVAIEVTFMDIQSFKSSNSWNSSSISFIDRELITIIENLL